MATRVPIASDNFNRSDSGSLGSNWTDLNPNWGTADIVGNQAVAEGNSGGGQPTLWAGSGTFTANQYAGVEVRHLDWLSNSYRVGVILRGSTDINGARDFYGCYVAIDSPGPDYNIHIIKVIDGTETTLDSIAITFSVGDTIELEIIGTSLQAYKNGSIISGLSATDSDLSSGNPGILLSGDSSSAISDNWFAGNLTTGQDVSVGLVSETDSVLVLAKAKSKSVGLNTETDSVLAATKTKSRALGLTTETDSNFSISHTKSKVLGLNSETDSVLVIGKIKSLTVGLNTEADSVFSLTHTKSKTVGLNTETDSVLSATRNKSRTLGLNTETDSVFSLTHTKTKTLGLNTETDSAISIGYGTVIEVGLVTETNSVFAVTHTKSKAAGLNSETDSVLALSKLKTLTLALLSETDSVFSVAKVRYILVGLNVESESVFTLSWTKQRVLGLAAELDTSLPLVMGNIGYLPVSLQASWQRNVQLSASQGDN